MKTVAEQLGQTPHLSPLLRRLRMLGLANAQDLRRLAVARGCDHYRSADDVAYPADPGLALISNVELAVAMVSGAQDFGPVLVRCAAQLLSGDTIPMEALARLAIQERAVPVIRHIARAALEMDVERTPRWQKLLSPLPNTGQQLPDGRLPHPSRFAIQTGIRRVNGRLENKVSRLGCDPSDCLIHEQPAPPIAHVGSALGRSFDFWAFSADSRVC